MFSTAHEEKNIFYQSPLSIVGLARGKASHWPRDETRVSLMWWAVCFARVESGFDLAHGIERNVLLGFWPVILP